MIVIPILVLIAVGVGDFGRVYATGVAVESAAREAADYAAFDDLTTSHFYEPVPGTVEADDVTRHEALRRACAAVSSLPGYEPTVAAHCADSTARCIAAPGEFCQLVVEDQRAMAPWITTCQPAVATADVTCGWVVHVTVKWEFHTLVALPPFPTTVSLARESHYAISALPAGAAPAPSP